MVKTVPAKEKLMSRTIKRRVGKLSLVHFRQTIPNRHMCLTCPYLSCPMDWLALQFLMLLKARVQFEFQFDLLFIVHCIGIFIHIWGHFVTIFRSHACEPLIDVIKLIRQINMISNKNSKRERNHCGSLL